MIKVKMNGTGTAQGLQGPSGTSFAQKKNPTELFAAQAPLSEDRSGCGPQNRDRANKKIELPKPAAAKPK